MSRKLWMITSLLVIFAMLAAACGGGAAAPEPAAPAAEEAAPVEEAPAEEAAPAEEEAPAEEAAPAEEEAPAEEAAPAESEAVTETEAAAEGAAAPADGPSLTIWADDTRAEILNTIGAQFAEEYGIPVVVTEKGFGDIRDDFKVAGPAGEGPDIIIGAHDWLGELVENGLLAEVDLGDRAGEWTENSVQAFTYDGALYGMPYATENVAFVYNTDLVSTPPTTWAEVTEMAAQIEADNPGVQGYIIQENDPYHFYPIMTAFCGYVFGRDENGQYNPEDVGIDSEGTIAAATWLDEMYKAGHLRSDAAINYDLMHAAFGAGEAAMMITGPWALPAIRESGVPFAVADLPNADCDAAPFLGTQGFMVSAFTDDELLAQTFLQEFVATEETMQAIFDADPRPSAFVAVREAIEDEAIAAYATAGGDAHPMPAIPAMSAVWGSWGDAMQLVSQQREAPDVAFRNAAEQIRSAIAGN